MFIVARRFSLRARGQRRSAARDVHARRTLPSGTRASRPSRGCRGAPARNRISAGACEWVRTCYLLEERLGVHELGVALDGGHALDPADAGRGAAANYKAGEAGREARGLLAMRGGDGERALAGLDRSEEVLRTSGLARDARCGEQGYLVLVGHDGLERLKEARARRHIQALPAPRTPLDRNPRRSASCTYRFGSVALQYSSHSAMWLPRKSSVACRTRGRSSSASAGTYLPVGGGGRARAMMGVGALVAGGIADTNAPESADGVDAMGDETRGSTPTPTIGS
jgi:hypothetical protein